MSFYKKSRKEKLKLINQEDQPLFQKDPDPYIQNMSENVISELKLPFSIAPNLVVNNKEYFVPMSIEESSVVAAVSKSFKFWKKFGGFKATVINNLKSGTIYTKKNINEDDLKKCLLSEDIKEIDNNMKSRNAGFQKYKIEKVDNYNKLKLYFKTSNAMGANYINTFLETVNEILELDALMCILSNNYQDSTVEVSASCPLSELSINQESGLVLANKLVDAYKIAQIDKDRAVTHNKGIYNGIDAVLIATGNDFRAVEAAGHAFHEKYKSLSDCFIQNGKFFIKLTVPLSLGLVGGATKMNPICSTALNILKVENSEELMKVVASVGLAQNFIAVTSLVTTGIQKGHMKMHLENLLNNYSLTKEEKSKVYQFFKDKTISKVSLDKFITNLNK